MEMYMNALRRDKLLINVLIIQFITRLITVFDIYSLHKMSISHKG